MYTRRGRLKQGSIRDIFRAKVRVVLLFLLAVFGYVYIVHVATGDTQVINPLFVDNSSHLEYETGFSNQMDLGLADFIAKRWILAPSKYPINLNNHNKADFSQYGQAKFIDYLLGKRIEGFFVECGAGSGEELSNTLFFEQERGWTGLLIEADPRQFHDLLKKNRHAYLLNACLSPTSSTGVLRFYSHGLYGRLDKAKGRPVQCFPFYPVLRATGQVHVDYFSLDVEGSELPILRTIPFHAVFIDVIGVEYRINHRNRSCNYGGTMKKLTEIREFFKVLGLYKEVGILPWGTHVNKHKIEAKGVDVFFKHV